jgi:hypothetical protein
VAWRGRTRFFLALKVHPHVTAIVTTSPAGFGPGEEIPPAEWARVQWNASAETWVIPDAPEAA